MLKQWKPKPQLKGYVALVLHAHLPYVRHCDRDDYLEERWFYEAMTDTYLPLIEAMDRLLNDGVDFRLTISVTPTLLAMFSDPLMQQRYLAHLDKLIRLAESERQRLWGDGRLYPVAAMYAERFRVLRAIYLACGSNIIAKLKQFQDLGKIEIITSAATHAFLPLVKTEEAIRAQLATGIREYERHFGLRPRGMWLPECGITPGIDRMLGMLGIEYCIADASAIECAAETAEGDLYAPVRSPYGVTVFPRDMRSAEQVWSASEGYPGHFDYREYYRDIGWDLGWHDREEWEYIRPYLLPNGDRVNTGLKYFRITGHGLHQEPYNPEWARRAAAEHAGHFIYSCRKHAEQWRLPPGRKPVIVAPYDAELFGHWWYEGPMWIELLCRKMYHDQKHLRLIALSEYLDAEPPAEPGLVNESSWGRGHSAEVWLQGANDWIYRHLHQAEERMIRLAGRYGDPVSRSGMPSSLQERALNQAARELMLAQSSDWAFIMDSKTVVDYACTRMKDHLGRFHLLCDMAEQARIDEALLAELERMDNCFPEIRYSDYIPVHAGSPVSIIPDRQRWLRVLEQTADRPNTFMLAWEYPPKYVGGLSRAVANLSEALAARGEIVHVVTTEHEDAPSFEVRNGVYVHRLPVLCSGDTDFYHWTFEMNVAIVDHLVRWKEAGGRIDLLHAHDWMVFHAAREIKHSYGIPLAATIHATEWGRNQGKLHGDLQRSIHELEWQLTYEAGRVFVCSGYMKEELQRIFQLPEHKIDIFPNGVHLPEEPPDPDVSRHEIKSSWFSPEDRIVLFVGRLVYEKGVQLLIEALPGILAEVPRAKLVIAGTGPMQEELQRQAGHLGDRVVFWGYVDDDIKARLYQAADVCAFPSLYEPFGIVALEAMSFRRPVVVADTGGFAEIVRHGTDGYKALPGHVESLRWHVTDLLHRPELGRQMADRAYDKLLAEYNWNTIAAGMQEAYAKLAPDRSAAAAAAREGVAPGVALTRDPSSDERSGRMDSGHSRRRQRDAAVPFNLPPAEAEGDFAEPPLHGVYH
ncbi:1,4-alpha-glucan branching protein domain-containing protein [Gordoniibacillus kamchatkensis]|uniref:1,4-alpha-glucan branching protein domain-containing protein n=1 Tax=Gordoniibacillus kamchatkensis TaxID=1590651 RepID=UPI0009E4A247|nr:1,4-alpha-glucan branching protein domain-containing protein [Paenibacillus sp. VKM B-2647]